MLNNIPIVFCSSILSSRGYPKDNVVDISMKNTIPMKNRDIHEKKLCAYLTIFFVCSHQNVEDEPEGWGGNSERLVKILYIWGMMEQ